MDWAIFLGVTGIAMLATGFAAALVARSIGRAHGELGFVPILLAIVITSVVLLGASRLAVALDWAYGLAGIDTAAALDGKVMVVAFAASFLPIAAYVGAFFLTVKKVRGTDK
jgi:hypothetical protein